MATMVTMSFDDLLNAAVEQMTGGQRRRFDRRCRFVPGYRKEYIRELADKLSDDPRVQANAPLMAAALGEGGISGETQVQFDGSKLKLILDIILEYGPKLLDLILLFVKAFSCILLLVALSSTANAMTAAEAFMEAERTVHEPTLAFLQPENLPKYILPQWGNCPGGVCPVPSGNVSRSTITIQPKAVRTIHTMPEPVQVVHQHAEPSVPSNYQRRWYNHDGLSIEAHAEHAHGYSTAGMSHAEIAYHNDVYHDQYGGGHPVRQVVWSGGTRGNYAYPVAGRVVRVTTAPARFIANRQPVRTVGRGVVRGVVQGVAALRPVNIASRIRGRIADRQARRAARWSRW